VSHRRLHAPRRELGLNSGQVVTFRASVVPGLGGASNVRRSEREQRALDIDMALLPAAIFADDLRSRASTALPARRAISRRRGTLQTDYSSTVVA